MFARAVERFVERGGQGRACRNGLKVLRRQTRQVGEPRLGRNGKAPRPFEGGLCFGKAGGRLGDVGVGAFASLEAEPGLALDLLHLGDHLLIERHHAVRGQHLAISLDRRDDDLAARHGFTGACRFAAGSRLRDPGADPATRIEGLLDGGCAARGVTLAAGSPKNPCGSSRP